MEKAAILVKCKRKVMAKMKDAYGRTIEYLRVSLTDRCNLRCGYCMPYEEMPMLDHAEILRYEEILSVIDAMSSLGLKRVRLTGGEPLLRRDIEYLAQEIKQVDGIDFLGITTNGTMLSPMVQNLKKAGVDGINISLDTTSENRYELFTKRDMLTQTMKGIQAAVDESFQSVKINCVLAPYSLPEDWLGVVQLAKIMPVDVRLIEWMPISTQTNQHVISGKQALNRIEQEFGKVTPLPKVGVAGPADYFKIDGFKGRIGIIHAMSNCFCESCNRVRLTATGDLKLCLFYNQGVQLKPLLRDGISKEELSAVILQAIQKKPLKHAGMTKQEEIGQDNADIITGSCGMYGIGG